MLYRCYSPSSPILMQALLMLNLLHMVSVQSVNVGNSNCTRSGGLEASVQCTFDEGNVCSLLQDSTDDKNWIVRNGGTPSYRTGPDCDPVNCQTGRYIYLEASSPSRQGDLARLTTPTLGGNGSYCLFFYYNMNGDQMGSLGVKLTNANSGNSRDLWNRSGDQGSGWRSQRVDFTGLEAFTISFEGRVGNGYRGDMALDTISVTPGACSGVRLFDCNFERNYCDWQNVTSSNVVKQWTRFRGSTPTPNTGPSRDRTSADGYYVYVEASRSNGGDKARLRSPAISNLPWSQCLTFWYHMYGSSMGNLTVYTQSSHGNETVQWTASGNKGEHWLHQSLDLTSNNGGESAGFFVIFEAVLTGARSDVALDDISITATPCGR